MLSQFYKSVLNQDRAPVVICDLNHTIIYMNPVAISRYAKWGGAELTGKSLMGCHSAKSQKMICKILDWFAESKEHNIILETHNDAENKDVYMVALRDDDDNLIGYYEKHEYRNLEASSPYDFEQ